MEIRQIYTSCLAQASYYLSSAGSAAVVDPLRDVDAYIALAAERGDTIRYVLVTHFHADFVSGHQELAARTGAQIVFGSGATPAYPALIAEDGCVLPLGDCTVQVLHTPGHTVESACFLLHDPSGKPHALFSGDTLFVGDVGRPDLLSGNLGAEELAALLYDSIERKIRPLPDDVLVYPGHGAGSACGKNLGKETWSTLAVQRAANPALLLGRAEFIRAVTTDQPVAPAYFFRDAQINKAGCTHLNAVFENSLRALTVAEFRAEAARGATVLDTRSADEKDFRIITGALHIGLEGQFAIWAGTLIAFDTPLLLVADPGTEKAVVTRLARIGFDKCVGYLEGSMDAWEAAGQPTSAVTTIGIGELRNAGVPEGSYVLLDVRRKPEVDGGYVPLSIHIPLEVLTGRLAELDPDTCYVVYCAAGYRSQIAVSLLLKHGFRHVYSVDGGIAAIQSRFPELVIPA